MPRSGEKSTKRKVGMTAIAPTKRARRSEKSCPSAPPASVPIGIVPQTIHRIAAFGGDGLAQADLRDVVRDAAELGDEEARDQQRQRGRLRCERDEDLRERKEDGHGDDRGADAQPLLNAVPD